ncbi:hypothetical protein CAPTEDRAFT_189598 [Capitella teleta]|uniref:SAM domain-containing protein n=1 Tax=Capitella teleta TaxID=283909 RepID=R7VG28_CAPTE|nr:hypothetical protein CAPTEDRAFT_189598 [Capitella teleta]|eukprot:ELU17527.1 hypothetical protein CAPTEDRAFT_189598 [Capitella teleta]
MAYMSVLLTLFVFFGLNQIEGRGMFVTPTTTTAAPRFVPADGRSVNDWMRTRGMSEEDFQKVLELSLELDASEVDEFVMGSLLDKNQLEMLKDDLLDQAEKKRSSKSSLEGSRIPA